MGCLGIGLLAAVAAGQPDPLPRHENWDPPAKVTFPHEGSYDAPVDMLPYFDSGDEKNYVYVAGRMTTLANGTVYTLLRYDAEDHDNDPKMAVYPPDYTTFSGTYTPTALAVDVSNGDVYITGSAGTWPDRDYLTVKFRYNAVLEVLQVDASWGSSGAVTFDGEGEGDDAAADVIVYDEGCKKRVIVTGTSDSGEENGAKDIVTVGYYPYTSNQCDPPRTGGNEAWIGVYDGPASGNDKAVEMAALRIAEAETTGPVVVVAGVADGGADTHMDLVAICYINDDSGTPLWYRTYDGPVHGDEVCTGIAYLPDAYGGAGTPTVAVLCGSTPHCPATCGDTDYIVWAVNIDIYGTDRWEDEGDYGVGRGWTPTAADEEPDIARDIIFRQEGSDLWVWVTGEAFAGGSWNVGTVAFNVTDVEGDLEAANTYNAGDDYAVSIAQTSYGIFVAGTRVVGGATSMFTLQYDGDATLEVTHEDADDADAYAMGVKVIASPSPGVFTTGSGYLVYPYYGIDWVTFRYEP